MPYDTARHPLASFVPATAPLSDVERRRSARHGPGRGKPPVAGATSLAPLRGLEPTIRDETPARPRPLIPLTGVARAPAPDDLYPADAPLARPVPGIPAANGVSFGSPEPGDLHPADAPLARPVPGIPTAFGVPFGSPEPGDLHPADAPLARPVPNVPTAFGVPFAAAPEAPADPAPGRLATARLMNLADAQQDRRRSSLATIDDADDQDVFAGIGGTERDLAVWHRIRADVDSGRLTPEMVAQRIGNLRRAPVGHTLADQQLLAALEIMQDRDLARRQAQGLGLDPARLDRLSRMRAEGGSADGVADEIRGLVLDLLPFIGGAKATAEAVAAAEDFRRAMEAGDRDAMLQAGLLTLTGAAAFLPGGAIIARVARGAVKSALRGAGRAARKSAETVIPTHMARIDLATFQRQASRSISGPDLGDLMDSAYWNTLPGDLQSDVNRYFSTGMGGKAEEHARAVRERAGFSSDYSENSHRAVVQIDPVDGVILPGERRYDDLMKQGIKTRLKGYYVTPDHSVTNVPVETKYQTARHRRRQRHRDNLLVKNPGAFALKKDKTQRIGQSLVDFRLHFSQIPIEDRNIMIEKTIKKFNMDPKQIDIAKRNSRNF